MQKYSNRIKNLNDGQKIRILTGLGDLSGKDMKNLGIPTLRIGNMKDYARDVYPHTTSLSHAWNTGLWKDVASVKVNKLAEDGVQFAVAPGAKIKLSPYRKETTEDPYLAAALSGSYLSAATDAKMTVGASGYYVTECDAAWLDAEPDNRILNEYVARPYRMAKNMALGSGVVTDIRYPNKAYENTCEYIQSLILDETEFLVCEHANDDNTVQLIASGVLCLHASSNALSSALARYRKMRKQIDEGRDVTIFQLDEAVKKGKAISDEVIDLAVTRALDFIFACTKDAETRKRTEDEENALALQATLESTVLLKNKNALLPLHKKTSVAIIDAFASGEGETELGKALAKQLRAEGFERVRFKRMSLENGRQANLDRILPLCQNAEVTVLLLGSGYEAEKHIHQTEKLTLPPEQLYLAEKLEEASTHAISVILSEHGTDVEFTRSFEGVLFAPLPVKYSAESLAKILCGAYNPSGRLAYTLYSGTETSLKKGMGYLHNVGMKSGPFVGYRYYDTAGLRVGYPFGHGLSYSNFLYYDLEISEDSVSFSVQNCTDVAGTEVAQIYVGIEESSIIRPKKELCGFAKVELKPFERKMITLKIDLPTVFYGDEFVLEKGRYSVYVGASVSDLRLKGGLYAGEAVLEKDGERLSDYLQSHSNILNDNYTLEANYSVMKKGITNIVAGVVSLALAIALAAFNITMHASSMVLGIISGILAVGSILFFIVEVVERSHMHTENRKNINKANEEHFEGAEQIPVLNIDKMFSEAFDIVEEEEDDHPHHIVDSDGEFDYSELIDTKLLLRDAVAEFNRFAAERGYKMGHGVTENLFASLSVSKLLILDGLSSEEFEQFVMLISEYFECALCLDTLKSSSGGSSIFFERDAEGYGAKKNIFQAIENAAEDHSRVSISAADGVSVNNIVEWLTPVMRYARSPKHKNMIPMRDFYGEKLSFVIGTNLWMLLRLSDLDTVDMLPVETVKFAPVVNVSFVKCPVSDDLSVSHGFGSYQFHYMLSQVRGKYEVSEETWKKVDKLEKYATQHGEYRIGNKLWLDIEKQMELLLSCAVDSDEATDMMLATKILPSMSVSLNGKLGEEDKTVQQMVEFIFGIDQIENSTRYLERLEQKKDEIKKAAAEEAVVEEAVAEEAVAEEAVAEEAVAEEVTSEEASVKETPAE